MRVVLQRVTSCILRVEEQEYSRIGYGFLILLGIDEADTAEDMEWLTAKIAGLRIFDDDLGNMNLDIRDIGGEIMIVSQFTLHASLRKGNRPSYIKAAKPDIARPLYEDFIQSIQEKTECNTVTGQFGAHMELALVNDGPVTIFIDSKNRE
ncbi:MAG: D-aminoacyl-tRNA deacylase [Bacteroidota bacterium]